MNGKFTEDYRVLVYSGSNENAEALSETLRRGELENEICASVPSLCKKIEAGVGAVLVTDDALRREEARKSVIRVIRRQPYWSDLPLLVLSPYESNELGDSPLLREFIGVANPVLLPQPTHAMLILNAVRGALQTRYRQYQVCRENEVRQEAEETLRAANASLEDEVARRTASLERQTARLRQRARQLMRAEEVVHRRIAEHLHDNLQQILVAIQMRLASLHSECCGTEIERMRGMVKEALDANRLLVDEIGIQVNLAPDFGCSINRLRERFAERFSFEVETNLPEEFPPINDVSRFFLLKAIQELLFNALRHSEADCARVSVEYDDVELKIEVSDEGAGLEPNRLDGWHGSNGFGLFNIEERLGDLGGGLEVASSEGNGARFRIIIPLEAIAPVKDV